MTFPGPERDTRAEQIHAARSRKPIAAIASDCAASAAYLIASAVKVLHELVVAHDVRGAASNDCDS